MKKLCWGVIAAVLSLSVHAEENVTLDILVGKSDQATTYNEYSASGQNITLGIRAGYTLIQKLKLELSYNDYRDSLITYTDDDSVEQAGNLKTESIDFGVKYGVSLIKDLSLYGHLGMSYWRSEPNEGFSTLTGSSSDKIDDIDLYYSVSLDYDMSENDAVGIEYKVIDMSYESDELVFENKVKVLSMFFKSKF